MEFHRGRLLDHVHLRVADVAASKRFYQAVLRSLGRDIDGEGMATSLPMSCLLTRQTGHHQTFILPSKPTMQ
jgi:catechol 2,3-dioxygenase-like lactoylglutathione lyase family enzyme